MEEDAFNAIREGNLEKLNSLIKSGCNVNTQDEYGRTMLLVAASLGQAEIVRLLVDVGADVNQVNHDAQTVDEYTALAAAASKNQKHIIDYLAPKTNFELKKRFF
ncbi:MAG: ankyrin repeat domain-containing protein [Cyanobacteria bacterium P01_H01_bin.58]